MAKTVGRKRLTCVADTLDPEREVIVDFEPDGTGTRVRQAFTPETTHTLEQQRAGWQATLDQYRSYIVATVARGN